MRNSRKYNFTHCIVIACSFTLQVCVSSGMLHRRMCPIRYTDMHVPLENRGSRPGRSLGHCHLQVSNYYSESFEKY